MKIKTTQKEIKIHSQSIKRFNYLPLLGSKKPLNNQDLNNKRKQPRGTNHRGC